MRQRDVIVVGGGFAGTTAARDLQKSGVDTLLLEARDRLGGRTWSTEREGWKVELGGTWIHWSQPFVWSETQRYGLAVEETVGNVPDRLILMLNGRARELGEAEFDEVLKGFDRFFEEAAFVWERPYDSHYRWNELESRDAVSVAKHLETLGLTPLQKAGVAAFLEVLAMGPLEHASYLEMMRVWSLAGNTFPAFSNSLSRYKLVEGTGALIEAMVTHGGFDVRLEAPVAEIHQGNAGVRVETADGEHYEAKAVVVAVPMNVLKDIAFHPAISATKVRASEERHAGRGFKIFLEVEGDPGHIMTLARAAENPLTSCLTYKRGKERSLLAGFGMEDEHLDQRSLQEWEAALAEFLPGVRVTNAFGHNWTTDPLTQGTWCTYKPGQLIRFADELARPEGRIFFAGADHGEGWRGFIDGAIGSGAKAAKAVARALGSSSW